MYHVVKSSSEEDALDFLYKEV